MRGYLYVADPDGNEIPGSRRSLEAVEPGTGEYRAIENELKRQAGDECTVRYSETERRLRDAGGWIVSILFFAALLFAR